MGSVEEERLLFNANELLKNVGLQDKPLTDAAELQQSASSMFVAIFESVFGVRLGHVKRRPKRKDDYVFNAQLVLNGLRKMLPQKVEIPSEISGEAIYRGEWPALAFMIALFAELNRVMPPKRSASSRQKLKDQQSAKRGGRERRRVGSTSRRRGPKKVGKKGRSGSLSASRKRFRTKHGDRDSTPSSRDPFLSRSPTGSLLDVSRPSENSMDLSSTERSGRGFDQNTSDHEFPGLELGEGRRHTGIPHSGNGLGPDGRPGTAMGGSRKQLNQKGSSRVVRPPAPPEQRTHKTFQSAPSLPQSSSAMDGEDDEQRLQSAWLGGRSVTSSSTDNEQSAYHSVEDDDRQQQRSFMETSVSPVQQQMGEFMDYTETDDKEKHNLIWDEEQEANQVEQRNRRVTIDGDTTDGESAIDGPPMIIESPDGTYGDRNKVGESLVTGTTSYSALDYDAEGSEDEEETGMPIRGSPSTRRTLTDIQKAAQQVDIYTRRQRQLRKREMERVKDAQKTAIKERTAAWRAQEHKLLQRAKARSRAAKHARKVSSIRTRRYLEDVQRKNLSLRLRRSNKQDVFMTALLRAVHEQQRMIAVEKSKAEQADQQQALEQERRKAEALQQELKFQQELFDEAMAQQAKDHEAAMKAQQQQLRESAKEAASQQQQLAESAKNALEQKEKSWQYDNVDQFDMEDDRFFGEKDPEMKLRESLGIGKAVSLQEALGKTAGHRVNRNNRLRKTDTKASRRRVAWKTGNIRGATMGHRSSGGAGGGASMRANTAFGSASPPPREFGGPGLLEETQKHFRGTIRRAKKKPARTGNRPTTAR